MIKPRRQSPIVGAEFVCSGITSVFGDDNVPLVNHTRFSFAEVLLGAGSYSISGALLQSAVDGSNVPFNATVGGISVTAVPLPASGLLLLGASGVLGAIRRRITA